MIDIKDFIANYSDADQTRVDFAWNGKHAAEFKDTNQEFRWEVVAECIATPAQASPALLEHLFLADSNWSREAWGSPHHFAQLGGALLIRGQESSLQSFSKGFIASFDTFAACHAMSLPAELLARLAPHTTQLLGKVQDESQRKQLVAASELFAKLRDGNAHEGWATLPPGTPVQNIRVIWPRWHHKAWGKLKSLWKSNRV